MGYLVFEIIVLLLVAYIIGCLIGWLLRHLFGDKSEEQLATAGAAEYAYAGRDQSSSEKSLEDIVSDPMSPSPSEISAALDNKEINQAEINQFLKTTPADGNGSLRKDEEKTSNDENSGSGDGAEKAEIEKLVHPLGDTEEADKPSSVSDLSADEPIISEFIEDKKEKEVVNQGSSAAIAASAEGDQKEPIALLGLAKPSDGGDDLKRIKGVGKVIEGKLHALGIYYFSQVANWGAKEIAEVDEKLSFKGRIDRENWIEQAKLLAEGKETEFSKRVDKGDVPSSS